MSNERTTILAIGIAALMMLCAVSGALIYSNNNSSSDRDVPIIDPVRPVDPVGPVEPRVNYLPDNLNDLNTMLSSRSYSDSDLLLDSLMYRQYRYSGSAYMICDTTDLACYLNTLGLTVFGSSLIPDYTTGTVKEAFKGTEIVNANSDDVLAGFDKETKDADKEEAEEDILVSHFKNVDMDVEGVMTATVDHISDTKDSDLNTMTIEEFTNTTWFSDSENMLNAWYFYLNTMADGKSTILDSMIGTPFTINNSRSISVVSDVNSLSLFLYSLGIEVVANNVISNGAAFAQAQANAPKAVMTLGKAAGSEMGTIDTFETPVLSVYKSFSFAGSSMTIFRDLSIITVADIVLSNLRMIDTANDSRSKVMLTASFLDYFNSRIMMAMTNVNMVDENVDEDGNVFGTDFASVEKTDSVADNIAMTSLMGTVFTDSNGQIKIVSDTNSYRSFLDSLGLVVKNNNLYCYSLIDSQMLSMDIRKIDTITLYDILTENNYRSFATDLSELQKIADGFTQMDKQKCEESLVAESTADWYDGSASEGENFAENNYREEVSVTAD